MTWNVIGVPIKINEWKNSTVYRSRNPKQLKHSYGKNCTDSFNANIEWNMSWIHHIWALLAGTSRIPRSDTQANLFLLNKEANKAGLLVVVCLAAFFLWLRRCCPFHLRLHCGSKKCYSGEKNMILLLLSLTRAHASSKFKKPEL